MILSNETLKTASTWIQITRPKTFRMSVARRKIGIWNNREQSVMTAQEVLPHNFEQTQMWVTTKPFPNDVIFYRFDFSLSKQCILTAQAMLRTSSDGSLGKSFLKDPIFIDFYLLAWMDHKTENSSLRNKPTQTPTQQIWYYHDCYRH